MNHQCVSLFGSVRVLIPRILRAGRARNYGIRLYIEKVDQEVVTGLKNMPANCKTGLLIQIQKLLHFCHSDGMDSNIIHTSFSHSGEHTNYTI